MVIATIIIHASSTTIQAKAHDPEMHLTKKGKQSYFDIKVHVGANVHSAVDHRVSVTPANTPDISQLLNLLREDDRMLIRDAGYLNDAYTRTAREAGAVLHVALKARPKRRLRSAERPRDRKLSGTRSRVEYLEGAHGRRAAASEVRRPPRSRRACCFVGVRSESRVETKQKTNDTASSHLSEPWRSVSRRDMRSRGGRRTNAGRRRQSVSPMPSLDSSVRRVSRHQT